MNSDLHIYDPVYDEIVEPQQNNDVTIGVLLDAYRNDSGPDPLQNTGIPVDNFEGATNMNESTTSQTVNYCMAVEAVQTVVNQLCQKLQHGNLNHSNDGAPI